MRWEGLVAHERCAKSVQNVTRKTHGRGPFEKPMRRWRERGIILNWTLKKQGGREWTEFI
jgi:hypothetical protein